MPLPTTATGPTNVYIATDDPGNTAGQAGSPGGGASGALMFEFTAGSLANAAQAVHILSSGLQRPLRWGPKFNTTLPLTLMVGVPAATAITQCPSGIGY